jgi:hypothetical protein
MLIRRTHWFVLKPIMAKWQRDLAARLIELETVVPPVPTIPWARGIFKPMLVIVSLGLRIVPVV